MPLKLTTYYHGKDIPELPDSVKEGLIITPVKTMDEVLAKALV